MPRIIIFGASTTYGCWDEEGGWVSRLRKVLDKKNQTYPKEESPSKFIVYNLGISGATSVDLLRRVEFDLEQRVKNGQDNFIIFAIGVNDVNFDTDLNDLSVTPENSRNNQIKLIEIAKKYTSKIIFVGATLVDESKTNPLLWCKKKSLNNENIKKFNQMTESVCKDNKIQFIDISEEWEKHNYKDELLEDGLHPNSTGHKLIFELVRDFLSRNKIISF